MLIWADAADVARAITASTLQIVVFMGALLTGCFREPEIGSMAGVYPREAQCKAE
jgi:hypothetical protein